MNYNKYKNQKIEIDGIKFDSKAESKRYCELLMLEKAGIIQDLKLQPRFLILDGFKKNMKSYRPVYYIADFAYTNLATNSIVVEDVKGIETAVFKLKRKMFEKAWPELELTIIKN